MDENTTTMAHALRTAGMLSKEMTADPEQEISKGWDELDADDKAKREEILTEHFLKALERFNAGVSLAKIRRHYEKLGAKYSPVTFRKKWEHLLKKHAGKHSIKETE